MENKPIYPKRAQEPIGMGNCSTGWCMWALVAKHDFTLNQYKKQKENNNNKQKVFLPTPFPPPSALKANKQNKTMSTNAQAKAWGYKKAIEITSNKCDKCRPPKKKVLKLSLNEIRNKISSGDIRPYIGEAMLKEMREQLPKKRSRVMKEYWQKKKREPIIESLAQQVALYKKRYLATKRKILKDTGNEITNQQHKDAHHALLRQHSEEYELAKRFRKELMAQINLNNIPTQTHINILIKQHNERTATHD